MQENLVIFSAVVLVANAVGVSNDSTALGASIFFFARVAHAIVYAFGWPVIRPPAIARAAAGSSWARFTTALIKIAELRCRRKLYEEIKRRWRLCIRKRGMTLTFRCEPACGKSPGGQVAAAIRVSPALINARRGLAPGA
jgi:hypothetical protein